MQYNQLGKAGIKVSELSYGMMLNSLERMDIGTLTELMKTAVDHGVNMFDNAESYSNGMSESQLGRAIKSFRREDLVITTKIACGDGHKGPNDTGVSWKHLVEGTKNSLHRMGLDYIDLLFCHDFDANTPIEETVRAMDYLVRDGLAFYWGTSWWDADSIDQAYTLAEKYNCIAPSMAQPNYSMFGRQVVEQDYLPLYKNHQMGITSFGPLHSGLLTGKYTDGIPKNSRGEVQGWGESFITDEACIKTRKLGEVAKKLECTMAQMAIAWCAKNAHVSSTIMGASSVDQLKSNLKAVAIKDRLTDDVLSEIDGILSVDQ